MEGQELPGILGQIGSRQRTEWARYPWDVGLETESCETPPYFSNSILLESLIGEVASSHSNNLLIENKETEIEALLEDKCCCSCPKKMKVVDVRKRHDVPV